MKEKKQEVPVIVIAETKREVQYPVMSVMQMEKELGVSAIKLFNKGPENYWTIHELIVLIWAGILHTWPRLTVEMVSQWVVEDHFDFNGAVETCKTELFYSLKQILHIKEEDDSQEEEETGKN